MTENNFCQQRKQFLPPSRMFSFNFYSVGQVLCDFQRVLLSIQALCCQHLKTIPCNSTTFFRKRFHISSCDHQKAVGNGKREKSEFFCKACVLPFVSVF